MDLFSLSVGFANEAKNPSQKHHSTCPVKPNLLANIIKQPEGVKDLWGHIFVKQEVIFTRLQEADHDSAVLDRQDNTNKALDFRDKHM